MEPLDGRSRLDPTGFGLVTKTRPSVVKHEQVGGQDVPPAAG